MNRTETQRTRDAANSQASSFHAVTDSRKRKVRGLWQRNGRYYAQVRVPLGDGRTAPRRIALDASNLDQAKAELERARTARNDGKLPTRGHVPAFADFAAEYVSGPILAQKKTGTQENERQAIARWIAHLGGVRLDKLTPAHIHAFREKRLAAGLSPRTVNLDAVALRNVLKLARDRGHLAQLPEVRQLRQKPAARRRLVTGEQFAALLAACRPDVAKNAELFAFYLRFLALTGAREKEALRVAWRDVDFARQTVTIGSDGDSKNHRARDVDFSPELGALLAKMHASRQPDSSWLFPSPQRGARDIHAESLRESLNAVRKAAGLPWFGFHDLRHRFASVAVMAGLDFMTVASWLGHSDGGILIGKVYGHLCETHKKAAAQKLRFSTEKVSQN